MTDMPSLRRKRLVHRSRYRGFKEADLLFGRFARLHLPELDDTGMDQYEALLDETDEDVYAWVTGRQHVPARHDNEVFRKLKSYEPDL